jgi:hypothetical protein
MQSAKRKAQSFGAQKCAKKEFVEFCEAYPSFLL